MDSIFKVLFRWRGIFIFLLFSKLFPNYEKISKENLDQCVGETEAMTVITVFYSVIKRKFNKTKKYCLRPSVRPAFCPAIGHCKDRAIYICVHTRLAKKKKSAILPHPPTQLPSSRRNVNRIWMYKPPGAPAPSVRPSVHRYIQTQEEKDVQKKIEKQIK